MARKIRHRKFFAKKFHIKFALLHSTPTAAQIHATTHIIMHSISSCQRPPYCHARPSIVMLVASLSGANIKILEVERFLGN